MFETTNSACRRKRRVLTTVVAVLAATLTVLLAACSGGGSGDDGNGYRASIQLGWLPNIENGSFVYADQKGFYHDEGVDARILAGGPQVAIDAQVTSGKALVGLFSSESLANAVLNGAPLVAVSAIYQYSSFGYVTLKNSGITDPHQFEGKRLGVAANDRTTVPFLKSIGVNTDSITLVPVDGSPTPLVNHDVDISTTPKGNIPVALADKGIQTNFIPVADYGYNRWSSVLVVRKDSLSDPKKLKAIKGIIAATQRGSQAFIDNPDDVGKVVYDAYGAKQGLTEQSQIDGAKVWAGLITQGQQLYHGKLTEITDGGIATNQQLIDRILKVNLDAHKMFDQSVAQGVLK
ncbi:ABC transporter substrate-binding protein [Gordonia sp. DT219]|uniref:ABC transporter substrate-binding protein n=1 Tax=Gordonia sp. DT219 TaxID=3416658 RepID=UPI003CE8185D